MLVEREGQLASLTDATDDALAGRGRLVFLGGEAGVGKSALVRALAASVRDRCVVRAGGADNVTTAEALAAFREAVPEIVERLDEGGDRIGLFRALREALAETPGLVVLEDLHWADEATMDAVRFLGRRLAGLPVAIVATYRHDEVKGRHPLAAVMGDLATAEGVERIILPPLTVDGVAQLVAQSEAGIEPALLHARTGGNAFFVTELLAGDGRALPPTVADAVQARFARLDAAGQDAASAVAVLGTPSEASLIAAVGDCGIEGVDACVDAGVLVEQGGLYGFRHELARQAVATGLSAVRRRQLHRRAFRALAERVPDDDRRLAHHAAEAGDDEAAVVHATRAGERAARSSAHREAAEHYRAALRHAGAGTDRAALFVALSYECYLTDQLPEAIAARQRALDAHLLADDARAVGDDERWLSRLSWFNGRGMDAERYATRAIETLEPLGAGAALAMAYSNLAQLRMLADRDDEVELWGERALAMATELGDTEIAAHALNNLGVAALRTGRLDEGTARLLRSLELARAADLPEHAARAYTNLGSMSVSGRRYAAGLDYVTAGIAYCEDHDLDSWVRYMDAWRCTALAEVGRFDEAFDGAVALLAHPAIAPVSAIPAAAVAARVAARRGDDAGPFLAVATSLANETGELQRIAPAACAAAEEAWLRGETDRIPALTDAAWELARSIGEPWALGELAWFRSLAGADHDGEGLAEPFALLIDGDPDAAILAWDEIGSPLWAAYAAVRHPDPVAAARAVRTLEQLGASQAVQAFLRTRRDLELALPRRPRPATADHPAQLTTREVEVLRLLAEGLSTADIASELVLSPRTVEHHISAVLRKLDQPTRARAVVAAQQLGVLTA
ncbi:AAA family ATPase [Microbacterium sp. AZCO]|uniref:ATP-binding protein n=1 Tax=Microbacterium sp. AZCO TaxID=3142976 RepID=UPI0031F4268F